MSIISSRRVIRKDKKYLPEEIVFEVNYLGSEVGTISINFSRPGNQVLAQYFQFIHLGFEGYKNIQQNILKFCIYLRDNLVKMNFSMFSKDLPNPLFILILKPDPERNWTLYDLSDRMNIDGWQIPAYTLSKDLEDVEVMRVGVRQGTGIDLADLLIENMKRQIEFLDNLKNPPESLLAIRNNEIIKPSIYHH